ncbi:hypothetical protein J2W24_005497 [Variovorax boronicumulans]|uniref:hypothetical protein n=1 Tax=Variovorax boronicumulans TaxID=436515 RepID=UPI002789C2C1|nr:hypothetical protein [Variovorax boronicumulans]MDP9919817.1 hypothetical protein [Variovorax boronicumulans]
MKIDKNKLAALQIRENSHATQINGTRRAINEARGHIADMRRDAQMLNTFEARMFVEKTIDELEGATDAEMQAIGVDYRVVRRMVALNQQVAQLRIEEARLQKEAQPFLAFMREADRFVNNAPAGTLQFVECEPVPMPPNASGDALHAKLRDVRVDLASLATARKTLIDHPRSRADCVALMDRKIAEWQEAADRKNRANWLEVAQGERPRFLALETWDYGPLALTLLGADTLRASLLRTVDAAPEGANREARLKQLGVELDKVEREEERLICQLEQLGQPVLRRRDARPEIVLSVEE